MSPGSGDWLDQLEARLEQLLDGFLQANPSQQALLRDQLLAEAQALRSELLQLAAEIQQWRRRVDKARGAGAHDLAAQAQQQVDQLMERGRSRWRRLEQLGRELQGSPARGTGDPLDQAWERFEIEQDLERLRRRG
jgi:hercynine metabolism protein